MNPLILSLLFFTNPYAFFPQSEKEAAFRQTLQQVVTALAKRDSITLAKHSDAATGMYILHRPGVMDTYTRIGFSDSTYPHTPFYDGVKLTPLRYERLPAYDCERWSKTGTFVDTLRIHCPLSAIAKRHNKELGKKISASTIENFRRLERASRQVVIADNNGNALLLYLSFLAGRWVLTIIDKVTTDCSS